MYFRVVKVYCISIRQFLNYPTEHEWQAAVTNPNNKRATNNAAESRRNQSWFERNTVIIACMK